MAARRSLSGIEREQELAGLIVVFKDLRSATSRIDEYLCSETGSLHLSSGLVLSAARNVTSPWCEPKISRIPAEARSGGDADLRGHAPDLRTVLPHHEDPPPPGSLVDESDAFPVRRPYRGPTGIQVPRIAAGVSITHTSTGPLRVVLKSNDRPSGDQSGEASRDGSMVRRSAELSVTLSA